MRLSTTTKTLITGNETLVKYCNASGISLRKIKECNIEKMGDNYVFVLKKENSPEVIKDEYIHLENDLDTQPDVVLIMNVKQDNGKIRFETTEHTIRIINK